MLGPICGPVGARLVVGFEGTAAEVDWMTEQLLREWRELGVREPRVDSTAQQPMHLWSRLAEFPAADEPALVVKATMRAAEPRYASSL